MGIGISSFIEIVGAGPGHTFDIAGIKMFDSAEIRIIQLARLLPIGNEIQGQGHETTFRRFRGGIRHSQPDVTVEE